MTTASARTFQPRHVQLMRALFAAIAAVMITFSADHSAGIGLAVFSGFAIATGLVHLLSAWLVWPAGERWPAIALGIVTVVAGMFGGVPGWRTPIVFLVIVILWAVVSGGLEILAGVWMRRTGRRPAGRDALTVGIITVVLGIALMFVSPQYALDYRIAVADVPQTFTLTGITIAVGVFGGYAAIVAVYLGIAGLSPQRDRVIVATDPSERS